MVISHQHKFIFIKTAKTAGTSIEVFLSKHCGPQDVFTPTRPAVEGHEPRNWRGLFLPFPELLSFSYPIDPNNFAERRFFTPKRTMADLLKARMFHEHMPARIVRQRVPRHVWEDYHVFTIERNPWDKTLSHYHMQRAVRGGNLTLDEYFERNEFCVNLPIYCDEHGEVLVDEIIRYEDLADAMGDFCSRYGIPYEGTLGVRAKGDYRKDRRHYSEVLEDRHLKRIDEVFRKEIDMHGYTFENQPSTKQE